MYNGIQNMKSLTKHQYWHNPGTSALIRIWSILLGNFLSLNGRLETLSQC